MEPSKSLLYFAVLKLVCPHSANYPFYTKEPLIYSFSLVSLWCSIFKCLGNNSTCTYTIVISRSSPLPQTTHISTSASGTIFPCSLPSGWNPSTNDFPECLSSLRAEGVGEPNTFQALGSAYPDPFNAGTILKSKCYLLYFMGKEIKSWEYKHLAQGLAHFLSDRFQGSNQSLILKPKYFTIMAS